MATHTNRTGLYIMVFFCLLNSCDASHEARTASKELRRIADAVQQQKAEVKEPH